MLKGLYRVTGHYILGDDSRVVGLSEALLREGTGVVVGELVQEEHMFWCGHFEHGAVHEGVVGFHKELPFLDHEGVHEVVLVDLRVELPEVGTQLSCPPLCL